MLSLERPSFRHNDNIKTETKNMKRCCDLDSSGSVKGEVDCSCKCGDKIMGVIRDRELSDC